MAEALGKTRAELLLGKPTPLSTKEAAQWVAYYRYKKALDDQGRAKTKAQADAREDLRRKR